MEKMDMQRPTSLALSVTSAKNDLRYSFTSPKLSPSIMQRWK